MPWLKVQATEQAAPTQDLAGHVPWVFYQDPRPTYDNLIQGTRMYQGQARNGFYTPSKLQALGRWVHTNQSNGMLGTMTSSASPVGFDKLGGTALVADQASSAFVGSFPWLRTSSDTSIKPVFDQVDPGITSVFYTGISPTS